ncbi:hypothetical protein KDAU_50200 [Dictyobacter aurantiacus]|uniref:SCP2 domain-containing protein n=2 Tax=Dictyobacter aurantiacus TaxID=1936993 RepID=A0A401ZLD3_9CHLR|nr:hypothetical protein KDAU_50200 [Dictyobacter aurantiacus]
MEKVSLETRQHFIATDLFSLADQLLPFLQSCHPQAWEQRGKHVRKSEWTLRQTVAHLVSACEYYLLTLQCALQHETLTIQGFSQRKDLAPLNAQEILRRQHLQPAELIAALHQALVNTATLAQQATEDQLCCSVVVPVFNRSVSVIELLEMQLVHPGIVHASQVAVPANKEPLWKCYEQDYMHRMLDRFFRLMTLIYWPERGGAIHTTIQFLVAGPAGGQWYLSITPSGCDFSAGKVPGPQVTLWAANADTLCQFFTGQLALPQAILGRKLLLWGNLIFARKMSNLFSPI